MAKGIIIEKPNVINNWLIFGNFVDAVIVNFKTNVYDKELKKEILEVEYIPTDVMRWVEQMDYSKETDFDRTNGTFKSTYSMDMVGHIEPRTQGTRILLLCDYKGNKCSIFDKINTNLFNQNRRLWSQVNSLNSILVGIQSQTDEMLRHPQETLKKLYKLAQVAKESMTPAYYGGQGNESQGENEGQKHG